MPGSSEKVSQAAGHYRAGRLREAEKLLREALAAEPDQPDALFYLGSIAVDAGRAAAGEELLRRALARRPLEPAFHAALGNALTRGGRRAEALAAYRRALKLDPRQAGLHLNVGNTLRALGRWAGALAAYERALAREPDHIAALAGRAWALAGLGRREEALAQMAALRAAHPHSGELAYEAAALQMRCAAAWLRARRFAEAERVLRAVIAARPQDAAARSDLGLALIGLDRTSEAVAELEEALRLSPRRWQALHNLALARLNLDQLEGAFEAFEAAQALAPADAGLMANHAYARCLAHDFARGEALFQAALALERDHERASHYYANYLLGRGRFAEGWDERARRPLPPRLAARQAGFPQPAWKGEPLAGRGILVRSEQGLGDQIMFCGAVPDLLAAGARVALECDPRLERLFARSFPGAVVAPRGAPGRERLLAAAPDVQLPMGRLAHHLRRSRQAFPRHAGYLRADPDRVEHWRARLAALGPGRKIGISWAGGTARTGGPRRSTALADWLPVLRLPGLSFVSLQYTDCREELARLRDRHGIEVAHWPEAIDDYDETAALACALDGVASVCTSVIHLAGALGRPVQVLVPWWPAWRYLFEGEEMPWYPSVRLIRQARVQDWSGPIARLAEALARG